ncbi:hypothetical protein CROQUDRAFT_655855 [Cronartium quercuum f. sp. fusiforme G11]|uniref:CRAL-TRIO domain-containing protein n=1 Tax=Cronartium quercuum f. sp. fusiforme G11 TaxID=708437 RepID=A0A9P6NQE6_9BASI|nr:hypothetical protein CROQUDRAFT_655855 [Cronartium quercuum f. sp. fusiforme G11]
MTSKAPQDHGHEDEKVIEKTNSFSDAEKEASRSFWKGLFDLLGLSLNTSQTSIEDSGLDQIITKHGRERYIEALWMYTTFEDPDQLVIRFIRARKHVIESAIKMFIECLQWRIESNVDELVSKGESGLIKQDSYDDKAFTHQISSGKTFLQGFSKTGGPVSYLFARHHRSSEQTLEVMNDYTTWAQENVRLVNSSLGSQVTVIVDLAGFGLANMDWKAVLYYNKCLQSYYPEALQVVILHNAPWVFQGVWKALGPMLDPVVRSKFAFTKSNEELLDYVDKRYLFEEHGGTSTWKLSYQPPDITTPEVDQTRKAELMSQRKKLVEKYIEATNRWIDDSSATNADLRHFVALMMRVQGLTLDPYIRGKTFYHRQGCVLENGLIGFRTMDGDDSWEFLGHSRSRERVLEEIEAMKARFKIEEVDYPIIDFEL